MYVAAAFRAPSPSAYLKTDFDPMLEGYSTPPRAGCEPLSLQTAGHALPTLDPDCELSSGYTDSPKISYSPTSIPSPGYASGVPAKRPERPTATASTTVTPVAARAKMLDGIPEAGKAEPYEPCQVSYLNQLERHLLTGLYSVIAGVLTEGQMPNLPSLDPTMMSLMWVLVRALARVLGPAPPGELSPSAGPSAP